MIGKVSVVDDDPAVLDSIRLLLQTHGLDVECFSSPDEFLNSDGDTSCIVSDVRMPVMTGMELLAELNARQDGRPVILLTGHGDIQMAVQAIRQGAYDFVEKPFDASQLIATVNEAIQKTKKDESERIAVKELQERFASLSDRQKETMLLLVKGMANKEIAARLGISPRTVEIHRTWVMNKMAAKTLAELVKIGIALKMG